MAEIIDIRERRRKTGPVFGLRETAPGFRIRMCGPDLHWLGVVGGILAGALGAEGLPATFADPEGFTSPFPILDLLAGTGAAPEPGLLVAGCAFSTDALRACNSRTVLLTRRQKDDKRAAGFPGRTVLLPVSDPAPVPLGLAVACAGGAARLLGMVGWSALEQALRRELILAEAIESYLIPAFETYHRLAPWAGAASAKENF